MEKRRSVEEGKKRLTTLILDKILGERSVVTCRQIVSENIPDFVKDVIIAQAKIRVKEEKPLKWNFSSHFDFDDEKVQEIFKQMMLALMMSVKFYKNEIEMYVERSVGFNLSLRLSPIDTLERVLFSNKEPIQKDYICRQLKNVNGYDKYLQRLSVTIQKIEKQEVNKQKFRHIAQNVLKTVYSKENEEFLVYDFKEIVELFSFDSDQIRPGGIDSELVKIFLLSRGLDWAVSIVEKKEQQGKKTWRVEDIPDIFLPFLPPQKFGDDTEQQRTTEIAPPKKKSSTPKIIFPPIDEGFTVERKKIESQPPGPYPSLVGLISRKEQKTFIKRIFKNDLNAYLDFIEVLDGTEKWKKAKQIIDLELEKRNIDAFSKEALKLGDRVFSKFFASAR